jgi:hypothetical protein
MIKSINMNINDLLNPSTSHNSSNQSPQGEPGPSGPKPDGPEGPKGPDRPKGRKFRKLLIKEDYETIPPQQNPKITPTELADILEQKRNNILIERANNSDQNRIITFTELGVNFKGRTPSNPDAKLIRKALGSNI